MDSDSASTLLRSWKQIADYLKTSVRTVQRYEEMGLPVRRIALLKTGGVFAVRSEVDAWLLGQQKFSLPATQQEPAQKNYRPRQG